MPFWFMTIFLGKKLKKNHLISKKKKVECGLARKPMSQPLCRTGRKVYPALTLCGGRDGLTHFVIPNNHTYFFIYTVGYSTLITL